MKYLRISLAIGLLALSACSTISEQFADYPKGVAIAQASLTTADHIALAYFNLPVCGKTTQVLCKTYQMEAKIAAAENVAFNALDAAYRAADETSLAAAVTAVQALTDLTTPIKTQMDAVIVKTL